MLTQRYLFLLTLTVLIFPYTANAYDLPAWSLDRWWDYDSELVLDFNNDIQAEITLEMQDVRYRVAATENRQLQNGSQSIHNVYVVEYNGLVFGTGQVHFQGPIPVTLDVVLSDSLCSGEFLIETSTLNLISRRLVFSTDMFSDLGQGMLDIGDISLDYTDEFDSGRNLHQFPLNIGNMWTDNHDHYWFGSYRLYEDLFSPPIDDIQDFFGSITRAYDAHASDLEWMNGLESVKTSFDQIGRTENLWYSWQAAWYSRLDFKGTSEVGLFYISQWDSNLIDFGLNDATPLPTRTPEPPTLTPTPTPTTEPSPTPTGTLPSPSPTYTLPPWIPKTPTPTMGPPTPTPPPPDDRLSIRIQTNQFEYSSGDYFHLTTTITNPLDITFVSEYILLDVYSEFWFWPGWSQEIEGRFRILDGNTQYSNESILEFDWPEYSGIIENVRFWAFLTEPENFNILGDYDNCQFSYY